ncbi:MAG: cell division protein FtsQ/DivIB [Opitutales bacterium]
MSAKRRSREETGTHSWRSIAQENAPRAVNRSVFVPRRRFTRWLAAFCVLLAAGAGFGVWYVGQPLPATRPALTARDTQVLSLADFQFETDGVLSRDWVLRTLRLDRGLSVEAIDIFAVKRMLEREGQVHLAVVERLPSGPLRIRLEERRPVFRLGLINSLGQQEIVLVSGDGHVYRGSGYATSALRKLPFLRDEIVDLAPGGGFLPLNGLLPATQLWQEARVRHPRLARHWHSLRRVGDLVAGAHPEAFIEVHTFSGAIIVFRPSVFSAQLERLEEVLLQARPSGLRHGDRLDLSFREPVLRVAGNQLQRGPYP